MLGFCILRVSNYSELKGSVKEDDKLAFCASFGVSNYSELKGSVKELNAQ